MTGKIRIGLKTLLIVGLGLILTGCFSRSILVSFESNGGTPLRDVLVPLGDVLEKPDDPKKEGYVFEGWFIDIDLTTEYEFDEPVEKDMTLYAKWNPAKYIITWETNGGSSLEPTEVNYKATIVAPQTPTREGYVFTGWFYEVELKTQFNFQTTMPAKDFTLYAGWEKGQYNITFNTNGGLEVDPIIGIFGEEFDEPVTNRFGYTFQGWYLEPEFENEFTEFVIPSQDITLYAKWEPNDIEVTIFIYEGQSETKIVKYNEILDVLSTPVRTGYTFKGWIDAESGEPFDFSKPIRESVTISAEWERNTYTVTFETTGGNPLAPQEVSYDSLLSEPPKPTKTGHDFGGWFKDVELSVAWDFANDKVTENITLYAKWKPKTYRISFVNADTAQMEFKYGAPLCAPDDPTRVGHTFSGWYLESTFKTEFTFTGTMPAENKTLYAKWTINDYQLIFKVDGEIYETKLIPYGSNITETPDPKKVGYTFSHWEDLPETMPANDVTVNAIFTVNSYTIIYLVDGIEHDAVSVVYGAEITLLDEPTKVGYTFSGWSEAPATMPAEDIIVSGHFTVNNYELTVLSADLNKGSVNVDPSESPVAFNREVTVTAIPESGYIFSHWTDGSITVSDKATYVFIMPANDLTLTAEFTPESNVGYKISYYGESLDGTSYEVLYSTTLFGTTEAEVSAEERDFEGFTFDSDHLDNILVGNILGDGSLELKVYYTRNTYTLTYKVDGTEYCVKTFKYGEEITAPVDPVKIGYQFNGWINLPETMPAEDFSVAANFSIIEYSLTYQLNGGKFSHQQQVKYNIMSNFQIANPIREGYTFLGWTFMGQVEPVKDFKINPGRTGDLDLVANWKAYDYSIHYFDGGDSLNLEPNTYTIEGLVILPIKEKIGYNFLGWYDNSEFVGEVITEIPVGSLGDKSFYAKYEVITYTITYYDENWQPLNNSDLITEYTYDENEDLPLVLLPANIGIAFVWEDASGNYYLKVSAG
ncbi:MAG TPA: InlB B-repeat-containing protein, partial [Acholeplasmataceae bacterium]|nr:InlB B-repeat-containing protein [Acholeplasmataceae bacterium]